LLKGSSQLGDLVLDGLESLWGEGGGELDEGEDGVLTTDSAELSKDGIGIGLGLDGTELGGNDVKGFDDLGGGQLSLLEGGVVGGSGVSEDLLLLVEDVELLGSALDGRGEGGDLVSEGLDLVAGLSDLVGSEVDSSVVTEDLSLTFGLVGNVLELSILLLEDQVLSQVLEHLGNLGKGSLVLHLEGNGVEQLLADDGILKGLKLGIHGHVRVGSGLLDENGVAGN
jgi:hypothetical protein